jgi:hypothetical protein
MSSSESSPKADTAGERPAWRWRRDRRHAPPSAAER